MRNYFLAKITADIRAFLKNVQILLIPVNKANLTGTEIEKRGYEC